MSQPNPPAKSPLFGTAGLGDSFKTKGYKNTADAALYTASFGLNAFEYQCGRGVRLSPERGQLLAKIAQENNILYSLHAPYYISMSSMEEEKRLGSLRYIRESAAAIRSLGGTRVIFHAGSCGKQTREEALAKAKDTLTRMRTMLDEEGFEEIILCPETMGKVGQLGTLEEVLALCSLDKRHLPCIDFGHLNARTQGGLSTKDEYKKLLDTMAHSLQDQRASTFHVHFSKIEYSTGGEKRHLTFSDTLYGPPFEPLLDLCYQQNLTPTIICESAGTQAEDAQTMMHYFNNLT